MDKTGDPDQAFSYTLGNGNPASYDQRAVVDQGFLELVRLGELPASDAVVKNSLAVAGATISASTPSGTGILRYNGDGYGDCEVSVFHDCHECHGGLVGGVFGAGDAGQRNQRDGSDRHRPGPLPPAAATGGVLLTVDIHEGIGGITTLFHRLK